MPWKPSKGDYIVPAPTFTDEEFILAWERGMGKLTVAIAAVAALIAAVSELM